MLTILGAVLLGLIIATNLQVLLTRFINPPFSSYMILSAWKNDRFLPKAVDWTPLDRMSPNLVRSVLASEDQRFFDHRGFDWVEVRSAWREYQSGQGLRGASTVTMQTARNLFLWPGRNVIRKGLEAYYAVVMELWLPKRRILELYLNLVQFGPGVYGASAAARRYYHLPPAKLSLIQSARLVYCLPAPSRRSPLEVTEYMKTRTAWIMRQTRHIEWPRR
jgi:monofunctional biosynthetic peptidoglycan transglycosylase